MPNEVNCKADRHADADANESIQGTEEYGGHRAGAGSEAVACTEQPQGERRYRQIAIIEGRRFFRVALRIGTKFVVRDGGVGCRASAAMT
jgi:hypothetical protein